MHRVGGAPWNHPTWGCEQVDAEGPAAMFIRIRASGVQPDRVLVWPPGLQLRELCCPRQRIAQIMR